MGTENGDSKCWLGETHTSSTAGVLAGKRARGWLQWVARPDPRMCAFSTEWTLNLDTRASPLYPKEDRINLWFQSLESLDQCRLTFSGRARWPVFSAVRLCAFCRSHRSEGAEMGLHLQKSGSWPQFADSQARIWVPGPPGFSTCSCLACQESQISFPKLPSFCVLGWV